MNKSLIFSIRLNKKIIVTILLTILLSTTVSANILQSPVEPELAQILPYGKVFVDDDFGPGTPGWQITRFDKIQDGVDAITPGGIVFVYEGEYIETIDIDKTIKLIGENVETTLIKGGEIIDDVIHVTADNVVIKSLCILEAYSPPPYPYICNGIWLDHCSGAKIKKCSIFDNDGNGINLTYSHDNKIIDCSIGRNGFWLEGVVVKNGIEMKHSSNNLIKNCYFTENYNRGVFIHGVNGPGCQNNEIIDCIFNNNGDYGVSVYSSFDSIVSNCDVYGSEEIGIEVVSSNDVTIQNCESHDIHAGYYDGDGIRISGSNNINIFNCKSYGNSGIGIEIFKSRFTTMKNNTMYDNDNNFKVFSCYQAILSDFIHYVDTTNTADGLPIYYLVEQTNKVIDHENIGYLGLVTCENILVQNMDLPGLVVAGSSKINVSNIHIKYGWGAVHLYESSKVNIVNSKFTNNNNWDYVILMDKTNSCKLTGNDFSNNTDAGGIMLLKSTRNLIVENDFIQNGAGVVLQDGSNSNRIYHNNFIGSYLMQAHDACSNIWDDGYPSGGNYWSDYTGVDLDGDGIGDTPYYIDGGNKKDDYPLMDLY